MMQLVTVAQLGSSAVDDLAARVSYTGSLLLEFYLFGNSDVYPWDLCDTTTQYITASGETGSKNGPLVLTGGLGGSYRCLDMPNPNTGYKPDGSVGTLADYLYYLGLVQGTVPAHGVFEADIRMPVCSEDGAASRRALTHETHLHPSATWALSHDDCSIATSASYEPCRRSNLPA